MFGAIPIMTLPGTAAGLGQPLLISAATTGAMANGAPKPVANDEPAPVSRLQRIVKAGPPPELRWALAIGSLILLARRFQKEW